MIITERMFEDYKRNVKQGDCLIYGEAKDGHFSNSIIGEGFDIMVALCCLIQSFSEANKISCDEIMADIKDMLQTYADMKNQEGGDR